MRGHAELYYADWILMGLGLWMFSTGDPNALLVFAAGVVLQFSAGGTLPL